MNWFPILFLLSSVFGALTYPEFDYDISVSGCGSWPRVEPDIEYAPGFPNTGNFPPTYSTQYFNFTSDTTGQLYQMQTATQTSFLGGPIDIPSDTYTVTARGQYWAGNYPNIHLEMWEKPGSTKYVHGCSFQSAFGSAGSLLSALVYPRPFPNCTSVTLFVIGEGGGSGGGSGSGKASNSNTYGAGAGGGGGEAAEVVSVTISTSLLPNSFNMTVYGKCQAGSGGNPASSSNQHGNSGTSGSRGGNTTVFNFPGGTVVALGGDYGRGAAPQVGGNGGLGGEGQNGQNGAASASPFTVGGNGGTGGNIITQLAYNPKTLGNGGNGGKGGDFSSTSPDAGENGEKGRPGGIYLDYVC